MRTCTWSVRSRAFAWRTGSARATSQEAGHAAGHRGERVNRAPSGYLAAGIACVLSVGQYFREVTMSRILLSDLRKFSAPRAHTFSRAIAT